MSVSTGNHNKSEGLNIIKVCHVLFDTAAEGLVVSDKEGVIQLVNPRMEEMFGYTKAEMTGNQIEMFVPDPIRVQHIKHRSAYIKNPVKRSMGSGLNMQGKRKDGSQFPLEISLNHFNLNGKDLVISMISDITGRQNLNEELKKNIRFLKEAEKMARVGHYEIDLIHRSLTWSSGTMNILGLPKSNKVPTFYEFIKRIYKPDRKLVLESFVKSIEMHMNFDMIHRVTRPDGEIRHVHSKGYVNNRDSRGRPHKIFGIIQDITDSRKTEEQLRLLNAKLEQRVDERTRELEESQQMYRMIARNFPYGVINVFNKDLHYIFAEGMDLYKIGITSNELIGTSYLERLPEDIRDDVKKKLMTVFKAKNCSFEIETNNRTYLINAAALPHPSGKTERILVVEQNITYLKKAEEDIRKALQKEKSLNEFKSRFVSMASHEFRTPLTSILASVSLLSRYAELGDREEKQRKHMNRIKSSVHYLTNLLNDFLSLDKLEEGKVDIHPSSFDLKEFAEEITEEIQAIAKPGQVINYHHRGDNKIEFDKQMLKNIVNNLLSNAIKYSPENSAVNFDTVCDTDHLVVTVQDHGIGIPADEQKHLFERFFRAKNALNLQGTGLGLNIVKKYVDMVGGDISFTSEDKLGTTFTVKVPVL